MAKEVVLMFPGQGSQYVGMGKNQSLSDEEDYFKRADEALGESLSSLMWEGPEEKLMLTANTQPAILTHSIVLFQKAKKILDNKNIKIKTVLGHSVGEYAALVSAGVLTFEDAIRSVRARGEAMQAAVPVGHGKMIALMKLTHEQIKKACHEASTDAEKVMPANFNEPGQTVVSGHAQACDRLVQWLEANVDTPYRAVELKVSAPFHSTLMQPAAEKMSQVFDDVVFSPNHTAYIANIDSELYAPQSNPEKIKQNLIDQVVGSVRWTQSVERIDSGMLCLEVGPGRVLMGLARKINRDLEVISLDKEGALEQLEEKL